MKIVKKHTNTKQEDISIIPFIDFYYHEQDGNIEISGLPEAKDTKRPDYYIDTTKILIEVKEIHDRVSNQKHAQWGKIISKLQKAVNANQLLAQVKGTFLINTPEVFKSPTEQEAFVNASTIILNAVIADEKQIKVFGVDFEVNKVSEQESIVVFGNIGAGGSVDPSNTVYQNIKDKINSANNQLASYPAELTPEKNILLLVNKYYMPLWNWDLFKAIGRTYDDLLTYKNIDEIWYQFDTKDKGFVHKLLYKRSFFEMFEESQFENLQNEDYQLFANWFSVLYEMGDEKRERQYTALRNFLEEKKPHQIFPDSQTREEIVRFGLWLAEKGMLKETVWFIEQFLDDPNPKSPEEYSEDEKFNYDKQIREDQDVNTITTVLGHLAWDIQKLALRKEYIVKAFEFTQTLLDHPNLYVKLQAITPLVEIAARRQWIEEYDHERNTTCYQDFRQTVFDFLDDYYQYRAIANWLTHVFYYFKDLNTDEAISVLDKLKDAREVAPLYVYFGIFRKNHYAGKMDFDSDLLKEKLESVIKADNEAAISLKGQIAWQLWKILKEDKGQFGVIKPCLDIFFDLPYDKKYYSSLERIIDDLIEDKPDICLEWFSIMITKLRDYVGEDKLIGHRVWVDPEKVLKQIANRNVPLLINSVEKLVELWKLEAFVGSPREMFETYKLIEDVEAKTNAKEQFKTWYEEMKALNPKLEEVSWDE